MPQAKYTPRSKKLSTKGNDKMLKFIKHLFITVLCVFCMCGAVRAADNVPFGDIQEYGQWLNEDNIDKYNTQISEDLENFQKNYEAEVKKPGFVPIEAKIGFVFMKSLTAIDSVLQKSLVPFAIIFLFVMYALWIALESYKMMRDTTDYKTLFYEILKKGIIIAVWVGVLDYGLEKFFDLLIGPILSVGTYFSDFILDSVAQTHNIELPKTCDAIHQYVNAHNTGNLLVDSDTAANIMCLPGRISVYFYRATLMGFKWMLYGFGHSATAVVIGAISIFVFVKCIFKYAFMTLGIVADLFLTLLMLPFTAIAEATPTSKESNYAGQVFNGLLKLFNTKKLSEVILVFINAAIYFVSLSIIIAICAALLLYIMPLNYEGGYSVSSGIVALLTGCLILYLTNKIDEFATQLGGKIDNSFGTKVQGDAKKIWGNAKNVGSMIFKEWIKK